MIQAIFFDVDGTLLSHRTNLIPQSTIKAFSRLREKGILCFMSTGRHVQELRDLPQLQQLTFDGYVTLNGQYCYRDDSVIHSCPIQSDNIDRLMSFLKRRPFPCLFLEGEEMYMNYYDERVIRIQEAIHSPLPPLGDISRAFAHPVYQIVPYIDEELEGELLSELHDVETFRWTPEVIDLIAAHGGKGRGIRAVCEYYHLKTEETLSFGDALNDLPMFQATGFSVAMGNSPEDVKQAATYVCDDIDHDGLYKCLIDLKILEEE